MACCNEPSLFLVKPLLQEADRRSADCSREFLRLLAAVVGLGFPLLLRSVSAYCRLVSMIAANHAKASMILVVMLDPSMTVRPVKLTLSLTGSQHIFLIFLHYGGACPHNEGKLSLIHI